MQEGKAPSQSRQSADASGESNRETDSASGDAQSIGADDAQGNRAADTHFRLDRLAAPRAVEDLAFVRCDVRLSRAAGAVAPLSLFNAFASDGLSDLLGAVVSDDFGLSGLASADFFSASAAFV